MEPRKRLALSQGPALPGFSQTPRSPQHTSHIKRKQVTQMRHMVLVCDDSCNSFFCPQTPPPLCPSRLSSCIYPCVWGVFLLSNIVQHGQREHHGTQTWTSGSTSDLHTNSDDPFDPTTVTQSRGPEIIQLSYLRLISYLINHE